MCLDGARAARKSILEPTQDPMIRVSIVWINVLPPDNKEAASQAAGSIFGDSKVCHFYDPERLAGQAMAQVLGGEKGQVAWDIYLFYDEGSQWYRSAPIPTEYMHQMTGSSWAGEENYRHGEDLVRALYEAIRRAV